MIKRMWRDKPLVLILWIALATRLLAAFFAPGYLMHDDHFLTIEPAAGWAEGTDHVKWLRWNKDPKVYDHGAISFTYPGILAGVILAIKNVGVDAPKDIMLIIRLLHALFSILIVYFSFKITERLSSLTVAKKVGLIMALLAIFPNFSVRNLVEVVCIPFILSSAYLLLIYRDNKGIRTLFYAGLLGGIAIGFRYQLGLVTAFLGIALLFEKRVLAFMGYGTFAVFGFALSQMGDVFVFGEAFTQIQRYIAYNSAHSGEYLTLPWFTYIGTLFLFILPPLGLAILFGFFRTWKKQLILFLPTIVFLVFHSIYPNKQERFILPVLPFVIILGMIGWQEWKNKSAFWQRNPNFLRSMWVVFWVLNSIGLAVLTFSYGKKARVEAMTFLYEQSDFQAYIQEQSVSSGSQAPVFYCGKLNAHYEINPEREFDRWINYPLRHHKSEEVNYILFYTSKNFEEEVAELSKEKRASKNKLNLEERVERMGNYFEDMELLYVSEGSWFDKLLYKVNPVNRLEEIYIYKAKQKVKAKKQASEASDG